MTKLHKVRAHMRRSPKVERPASFYRTTELLLAYIRQKNRFRVKAIGKRVAP